MISACILGSALPRTSSALKFAGPPARPKSSPILARISSTPSSKARASYHPSVFVPLPRTLNHLRTHLPQRRPRRNRRHLMACPKPGLILAGSIFFAAAAVAALAGRSPQGVREVRYPDPDPGVDSLPSRMQAQLATLNQFKVFHDFHFTDRLKESGITFVHHIVADA